MNVGMANGDALIRELDALMGGAPNAVDHGPKVKGHVTIAAIANAAGHLSHWEVAYENTGDHVAGYSAFIGTIRLGSNKNDGLGLESMPCPNQTSRAVQRIEANGNYGVVAIGHSTCA